MPDEAAVAPAPSAPAPSAAPSEPAAAPASSDLAPSADESLIGQQTSPPSQGGFKFVGDDGSFVPDWSKHLPDDFGDFRTKLANYKNPVELAKALHSANQTISKKGVIIPGPQSSQEELSAYRKQMGVPDTAKGYLEKMPAVPEGTHFDENIAAVYMDVAHKHNIPAAAMQELIAVNLKQAELQAAAEQQRIGEMRDHGRRQLRELWRSDFDRNMGLAERGVRLANGNPNSFGFRDPEAVRVIAALASRINEDEIAGAGDALPQGTHELKATAMDIIGNPQNKDYQKYRDGNPEVRSRVRRMLEQAESNNRR